MRVGGRDHPHVAHAWHLPQHVLDFGGLHLFAGNIDERRYAPGEDQPAALIERAVVAGQEAFATEVIRRLADVPARDASAPNMDAAAYPGGVFSSGRTLTVTPGSGHPTLSSSPISSLSSKEMPPDSLAP